MRLIPALLLAALPMTAAAANPCAGRSFCESTRNFVADVANFRVSKAGGYRVLTTTLSIRNITDQPLTLGFVGDSGVALDDRGNRYVVANAQNVRGIGLVNGNKFDPKFTLQPGEARDARFEFLWAPGHEIIGTRYELDLALREIKPVAADQFKLGGEYALHFSNLAEGALTAAATPVATAPGPAGTSSAVAGSAPAAAPLPAQADHCAGIAHCYDAGTFTAEVVRVIAGGMPAGVRDQRVSFNIRFRNVSAKPIILAYKPASGSSYDNFGNPFYWGRAGSPDLSAQGIGYVTYRSADTQFTLAPGQSRNATFNLIRFGARPPIGSAWGFDVVIDELEILPGQQVRTVRENSLSFQNLSSGLSGSLAGGGVEALPLPAGAEAKVEGAQEIASEVIGLFKKLKKH